MFFGATSFSASPFASPGGVSIAVTVNGVRMNFAVGNVVIEGKSIVLPTGVGLDLATSTVNIKKWDGIVPGATQTWVPIQTSRGS